VNTDITKRQRELLQVMTKDIDSWGSAFKDKEATSEEISWAFKFALELASAMTDFVQERDKESHSTP